ncbi:hypothetical protein [Ralstonia pseudosolanacearum]|uniref:hypothetical protein n=1 Tax=Ralstonia pseudosolanacearum TaxID=1310165 RepID=UPI00083CE130|nr:hypothetical protein [Ralstonia pseudosolanacearum]AOE90649.1 hypothetical protein LBM341_02377 [Ralstonia solanacearum]AOE93217.1 hypothetical protein LBM341_04973 [Ralstonia solanacearum]NKA16120.1 hypothetical protein [Ralstonia solanacearum]NKA49101.1 hypothetical protein [Ralstonia solanacearum]UYR01028.1 hypothetical protein NQS37_11870 [Ralstonia pseudosolanacearum]
MKPAVHKWQFVPRFRRHAFGWRSGVPIQRIKEAVAEIKLVARSDVVLAAEGAVKFLERVSPALEQVDSSSGALGGAVNRAIDVLAPIIASAPVDTAMRQHWLERLWDAIQEQSVPYIEALSEEWDKLCVTPEIANTWADDFLPLVEHIWGERAGGYFAGIPICLASLYAAGRHEELIALVDRAPFKWWHDRQWAVKALVALGRKAEALSYAEASRGMNSPNGLIAQACEGILLSSGLADEAYQRYSQEANRGTTYLATFRAIAKKYPHKAPEIILRDLIASSPDAPGKWFAAAKDAALFDLAVELASTSPTDPKTLTRAARDYAQKQPAFAMAAGMAALRWIVQGYGYEITGIDILDASRATLQAATHAGVDAERVREQIRQLSAGVSPQADFVSKVLRAI